MTDSDIVPEVSGDFLLSLVALRGASQIHQHTGQCAGGVMGEKQIHRMIVTGFNAKEVLPVGSPVHPRRPIAVDGAATAPNDGVGKASADCPRLPFLPCGFHDIGKSIYEEAAILIRRHEVRVIRGLLVHPGAYGRRIVRVGGIDGEFVDVEPQATTGKFRTQIGLEILRCQIAREEDCLLRTVVRCTGFRLRVRWLSGG